MSRPTLKSRLPDIGTTIFTIMSSLAKEHDALNLSQGFPDFDCDERLKALVTEHIRRGDNQYAPMTGLPELRERLSERIESLYGYAYAPENEICITAGATQAIFTAITAFIHPGDEVIIIEPAYDCYAPAIALAGGKVIRVGLDIETGQLPYEDIRQAINRRTRLVIINSPHNPSGTILSAHDMAFLDGLLNETDTLLLSDEVYEFIVFDGLRHESVARYPRLAERSIIVSSFGKTYHNTGWKLGYAAAPAELMKEFLKVHQFNVFCVNRPMQHAFAEFFKDDQSHIELSQFYQTKRDRFCSSIQGSRFKFEPSKGTYFQLLDYRDILPEQNDRAVAEQWTRVAGLASIPISSFYHEPPAHQRFLRFCFAKDEDTLDRAAEILNTL